MGVKKSLGQRVQIVSTLAVLKTLVGTTTRDIYVRGRASDGDGYQGLFRWDGSDLSTEITDDTQNAAFVPPDSDNTGASGAWAREFTGEIQAQWSGAVLDGSADCQSELSAILSYARAVADRDTSAIDVHLVKVAPGSIIRLSSDLEIPKRVVLDISGCKVNLDASVGIRGDQGAVIEGRGAQIVLATGHTGAAIAKKASTVGQLHILGFPKIISTDAAAQSSSSSGNKAVDLSRIKDSILEFQSDECAFPLYIDAQSATDTCYYNHVTMHVRGFNFGIYGLGEYFNGNEIHVMRISDGYRACHIAPGTGSNGGGGNNIYFSFAENLVHSGIYDEDGIDNHYYGMTAEGSLGCTMAYQLAGASTGAMFFGCGWGGSFDATKAFQAASGCVDYSFINGPGTSILKASGAFNERMDNNQVLSAECVYNQWYTPSDGATDVPVDSNDAVNFANTAATDVDNFTLTATIKGLRLIAVRFDGNTTIKDSTGNLRTRSGSDLTPASGDTIWFMREGSPISTTWKETTFSTV